MREALALSSLSTALALLLLAPSAHASPEDIFGYGPRSPAMGGTGVASSQGFEAAYTNPALLGRIEEKKLTLGLTGAAFSLSATGQGLSGPVSSDSAKGIVIGADLPIPFGGVLRDRIAAGFAFYTPSDIIVRGRILYPEVADYPLLADRAQSLMIRAGVGVNLPWGLRVGAGFAALAEIDGTVTVATDATGHVGSRVDDQLVATYAPSFGLSWDVPLGARHPLRLGATYRGQLDARFAVEIDATKLSTLNIPVFNIAGVAQYDPAEYAFEVAYDPSPWVLAAGITYKKWSAYPGPVEPTIVCPGGQSTCGALDPVKIPIHDTVVVRAGGERRFTLTRSAAAFLRAGAFYEPSPVNGSLPASKAFDQTANMDVPVPTRFFDADRVVFTVGGGVDLAAPLPPVTVDAYAQYHLLVNQHDDTPPTTGADLSGHVLAAGLLAGVKF